MITDIYFELLIHKNAHVSYSAKSALVRLLQVNNRTNSNQHHQQQQQQQHSSSHINVAMQRTPSKGSDTPTSTRSPSPPSVSSALTNSVSWWCSKAILDTDTSLFSSTFQCIYSYQVIFNLTTSSVYFVQIPFLNQHFFPVTFCLVLKIDVNQLCSKYT